VAGRSLQQRLRGPSFGQNRNRSMWEGQLQKGVGKVHIVISPEMLVNEMRSKTKSIRSWLRGSPVSGRRSIWKTSKAGIGCDYHLV
jgi:hypothetical protein